MRNSIKSFRLMAGLGTLTVVVIGGALISSRTASLAHATSQATPPQATLTALKPPTATTPIQHVVVIFDENESFDHYFGTYPSAQNPSNEPPFYAAPGTPSVNGLSAALLTDNPNQANPKLLSRSQAVTSDMDHGYGAELQSFDGGLMDKFVQNDGHGNATVMDYFDGNTVTALWNLAQHFALNDNFFGSNLGPSTSGAINLISGQTGGATVYSSNQQKNGKLLSPGNPGYPSGTVDKNGVLYDDADPYYDTASRGSTVAMSGQNIGNLLNAKGLTWGWFSGGYDNPGAKHKNIAGQNVTDYVPHHEPFQYYGDTSNVTHLKPTSVAMIGHTDQANHQYDLSDFWKAAAAGNMPAYSVLKAPAYEDGHPGYSDPIDEQRFIVETVNKIESLPEWKNTAIFITYDDSDGWYDHVMPPVISQTSHREGYGPRIPLLVVSPYARHNAVINSLADQASILRFVEDNWGLGRIGHGSFDTTSGSLTDMFNFSSGYSNPPLTLDPNTGEPVTSVKPFQSNGQLYMSETDLEQSLDVQAHQTGKSTWFLYGGHLVEVPATGSSVTVDTKPLQLGAPIVTKAGAIDLPVRQLAKALGVQVVQYKSNEILFKPAK